MLHSPAPFRASRDPLLKVASAEYTWHALGRHWDVHRAGKTRCSNSDLLLRRCGLAIEQLECRKEECPVPRVHLLLDDKRALLRQIRTDISYKAMMDVWLYVHVPITFALLAALIAHILAVLFFIPLAIRG